MGILNAILGLLSGRVPGSRVSGRSLSQISDPGEAPANDAGFSLIEVLASLVLLAFVALGVMTTLNHGIRFNGSSRDYTAINNKARTTLEELMAMPFNGAKLATGTEHEIGDQMFQITYTVSEHYLSAAVIDPNAVLASPAPGGTGNLKRIILTVTATNHTGIGDREIKIEGIKHFRS